MSALRSTAGRAVKELSWGADRLRPPAPGVAVLIYHRVGGGTASAVDLPAEVFARQLEQLRARYRVVSLGAALDELAGGGPVEPSVVVTFDDGTADFVEQALPVLVRHRVPVTLYVATAWVDEQRSFWEDGTTLSWSALTDALSTGFVTIGSHSHSHLLFDREPADVLGADLDRASALIEEHLEVSPSHFAYPKALAPHAAAEHEVRRRFVSAALAGTRPNPYGATDPYRLARSPIQVADATVWFRRKASGGLALEAEVRRRVDQLRYARATR
jgi:peptidoglycan/xylan/chitin deacetylase (PgdA/CDA1 family)